MTRDARIMSGIILLTVPSIQYGGYFLLTSLRDRGSHNMDNALRQNFFRAGHACGCVCPASASLSGVGGCRDSAHALALGGAHRSAGGRDPASGRFLSIDDIAVGHRAQRFCIADLCWGRASCCFGTDAGSWSTAISCLKRSWTRRLVHNLPDVSWARDFLP